MATVLLADPTRNAMTDATAALCNAGTAVFETAADGAVATCSFANPAFGGAAAGVATNNAIGSDTNAAGGTVEHCTFVSSVAADVLEADCTLSGGGGSIIMTALVITLGDTVAFPTCTMTMPAS